MRNWLYSLLLLLPVAVAGQDIHFSQYDAWPLNITPAQTGVFDGDYRFAAIQRTQWRSVTVPYTTFAASVEAHNPKETDNLGLGLNLMHDKTGDSKFTTLVAGASGTYRIALSKDSTHAIYPGVQTAFTQRKLDYGALRFDNQYDGTAFNSGIDNGEFFSTNSRMYFNLHGGIHYEFRKSPRMKIHAGAGVSNLLRPKQSFFNDDDITLDRRLSFYSGGVIKLGQKMDALPSVLVSQQGTFNEIIFGGTGRYILNSN